MNNLIKRLNEIKINKNSIIISLLALFFAGSIFVIPFIHCLTITNFCLLALATLSFGFLIASIILCTLLIFYKSQTFLIGKTFAGFFVPFLFMFSIELIILAIISFVTMLYPPLFLLVGTICFTTVCGFNIITMCKMLEPYALSTASLIKSVKIYNIAILCVVICLWLII